MSYVFYERPLSKCNLLCRSLSIEARQWGPRSKGLAPESYQFPALLSTLPQVTPVNASMDTPFGCRVTTVPVGDDLMVCQRACR